MRCNHQMMPPNGPHYPVADGVILRAATYDLLFDQIIEWRMRAGIEPGDPRRDVDNYICGKWPHFCQKEDMDGPPPSKRSLSMVSRVNTWTILRSREQPVGGFQLIPQDEAERRAAICSTCPANKGWIKCQNCSQSTLSILAIVRKLRGTRLDNDLMGCDVCGHDNRTAVHLEISDMPAMDAEEGKYLPPNCWKKK